MRTLEVEVEKNVEKNISTVHTNGSIEQLRGSPKHAIQNDMSVPRTLPLIYDI